MSDTRKKMNIKDMVLVGVFAAVMAVLSQVALPMPGGVPITIQIFTVALIGSVLGYKHGPLTLVIYILIGAVGAPVFSSMRGGLGVIMGTAGGYIVTWPVMAAFCGIRPDTGREKLDYVLSVILGIIGLLIVEAAGAFWWARLTEGNWGVIMIYSFTAFIPKDMVLTVLGLIVGKKVRTSLRNFGM